jgi:hypothetical protein
MHVLWYAGLVIWLEIVFENVQFELYTSMEAIVNWYELNNFFSDEFLRNKPIILKMQFTDGQTDTSINVLILFTSLKERI